MNPEEPAGTIKRLQDPSHDVLRSEPRSLDAVFKPRRVAVIGASEREGSVGRTVLANLCASPFGGEVYPVNRRHSSVLGIPCYPSILEIPGPVDLAVIITPAAQVPAVARDCVAAGAKAAIVISAGFRERGAEGASLERQVVDELKRGRTRLIGPNCLGVMNPQRGLNATFAQAIALPGKVAFLSQSGALLTAILDWSLQERVGFSACVSTGSMLDVGWGDLIDYFGDDPNTNSILIYMESIGDARSFLSAAREVSLTKPILVLKAGRSEAASKAAASHTGALTGSDDVLDSAFRRVGVLRVETISDLFHMADVLSKQPPPRGPRLTILTNAGGPAVLATDALMAGGGELTTLLEQSVEALNQFLPPHWSRGNPIDILGDADPLRYERALEIALADPGSDGLLAILAPQGMTNPTEVARRITAHAKAGAKPLLASWMGGQEVAAGQAALNAAGIPTFAYPDTAAHAFDLMWRYTYNLRGIYQTPAMSGEVQDDATAPRPRRSMIAEIRRRGRTLLTEFESKHLLEAYGIPTIETHLAASAEQAAGLAEKIGFPVVLKLHSETITHKTDVGGVKLNLADAGAVRDAYHQIEGAVRERAGEGNFLGVTVQPMVTAKGYELIVGSTTDAQFGPVIVFGSGGELVEVYRDRALALPPLNATLARRMMEQTRVFKALGGVRGRKPINLAALESLLVRFAQLIVENPGIKESDINPLVATPQQLLALDARFVLHPGSVSDGELPSAVIRPYPAQYVASWRTKDGTEVVIRPIRPEDEPAMVQFHQALSERSVYLRYFHASKLSQRVAHDRLIRMCFLDYDREIALLADRTVQGTGVHEILAIGRMTKQRGSRAAEIAVLVRDRYHRLGLGREILQRLIGVARDERLASLRAFILRENFEMQALVRKLGFHIALTEDPDVLLATLEL